MKKKLSHIALGSLIFIAGGAVGYAGTSWSQMEEANRALHDAHHKLHEAVKDDHYKHMRSQPRRNLDNAIHCVDAAIRDIDRIQWEKENGT